MSAHRFIFGDVADRIDVGGGVHLLVFSDDSHAPHNIGVEHACMRWADEQEPDGEFVKVIAPSLSPAHVVTGEPPTLTIRASIACPDCGLHGVVTDGRWA